MVGYTSILKTLWNEMYLETFSISSCLWLVMWTQLMFCDRPCQAVTGCNKSESVNTNYHKLRTSASHISVSIFRACGGPVIKTQSSSVISETSLYHGLLPAWSVYGMLRDFLFLMKRATPVVKPEKTGDIFWVFRALFHLYWSRLLVSEVRVNCKDPGMSIHCLSACAYVGTSRLKTLFSLYAIIDLQVVIKMFSETP